MSARFVREIPALLASLRSPRRGGWAWLAAALSIASLLACSGVRDTLTRGQAYYEDNRFEQALSVWRELARSAAELTPRERARYFYLRGMTAYRLGFRDDARHWLGLGKALEGRHPGGIAPAWVARLDAALDDLNRDFFGVRTAVGDPVQLIEIPADSAARPAPEPAPPVSPP